MTIKGIIFDMDGLMFDTERIYYKAWQEAASAYGYEINWEIYNQIIARNNAYIGKVLKTLLGEDLPYDAIVEKKRLLSDAQIAQEGLKSKEGLLVLLDALEAKGIKKAVATSSMREKALRYLEIAGITHRFDTIICGDEVEESKPNPEIFLKAAAALGITPEESMVLEDSRFGIQAAERAGMTSVFVPDLVACDEEIEQRATYVVHSLKEVLTLL